MSSRARGALVAVLGLLAPLVVLAPAAHADLGFQAPVVGSCYSYSIKTYNSPHDTSAPVPCTGPHTAMVTGVVEVSEKSLRGGQAKALAQASGPCAKTFDAVTGLSAAERYLTAYAAAVFAPTKAQVAAGARWVRCDILVRGATGLLPLPSPLVTDLSTPAADAVARCYDAKDRSTACSQRHTVRAIYAAKARGAYPASRAAQRRIGEQRCGQAAQFSSRQGFAWVFPTRGTWTKEQKFVVCLAITKK